MSTVLAPDDVEQAVIDELSPTFVIGTSIPEVKPARFLRVNAAGGFQRDLVTDTFTITLEAFAPLESQAALDLNKAIGILVVAVEAGHLGSATAYRLQLAGLPQNFPLPSVPSHKRYISTLAPDLRRRSITL